jgi:hypothetical protein
MEILRNPYSLGIVGGKIYHAMYFVGYNNTGGTVNLLGLDPHQTLFTQSLEEPFPSETYMDEVNC